MESISFIFPLIAAIIVASLKFAQKNDATKDASEDAAQPAEPQTWEDIPPAPQTWKDSSAVQKLQEAASPLTPKGASRTERKRMQTAQTELWSAAKRQQDDAERVHSVHMDTCESKLENLRILYAAGILDREEYTQRVARVKAGHAKGAS